MSNFYPYLFEEVDTLAQVDSGTLKKYFGRTSSSTIKKDNVNDEILTTTNKGQTYKKDDLITWEDYATASKTHKEFLRDFLIANKYDMELADEEIFKNKKKPVKKRAPLSSLPIQELSTLTYGDFWDFQTDKLYTDYNKEDTSGNETDSIPVNLDDIPEEFEISDNVVNYFSQNGKEKEFKEWVQHIPNGTKITPDLIAFFRLLDDIILNESGKSLPITGIIKIKNLKVKSLDKTAQDRWKTDMIEHIGSCEKPEDISDVYESQVLKHGEFLNALFMLDAQGVGRGEVLMTYLITGATFPGGGESFDLLITNNTTYEIKDYSNVEKPGSGANDSIRLGTGGKLTRFEFWKNLEKSISVAKKINQDLTPKELKEFLDPYLFSLWKHFTSDKSYSSDPKAIASAVAAGEVSDERLKLIKLWFYLVHELISRGIGDDSENYTIATLKGPNTKPKTISISPIDDKSLKSGSKLTVETGKNVQRSIDELSTLKYVKYPDQFQQDMDDVAKEYFNHNQDIDYFLVFRPKSINIVGEDGFMFAKITQAAVKIIEKEYIQNDDKAKAAFNKWKAAMNKVSKTASKEEKSSYKNVQNELTYKDFYQSELLEEEKTNPFYPQLF